MGEKTMLAIFLDKKAGTPLYEQLYKAVRIRIENGILSGNEKMPSKRRLAAELSISQITVENAYSQLVAEGYLRTVPKSGFYVETYGRFAPDSKGRASNPVLSEPALEPVFRYDFKTNVVDPDRFPYAIWAKLAKETFSRPESGMLNFTDPQGSYELRKAIAAHLAAYRGILADPAQIVVGAGSEYLLGGVIGLLGKETVAGIENPGYAKVRRTFQNHGVPTIPIRLDDQGLCVEDLEKTKATLVHVTPSHQFPSGIIMPVGRRLGLLQWALSGKNRFILEDDYDSEFRFSGLPIPALQGLDRSGKVIYFNSFSKSLAPSLRIGYMVLPPELLGRYRASFPSCPCSVSNFEQAILTRFLTEGYFERHLNRMRNAYKERRDLLVATLMKSTLFPVLEVQNDDAGLHFLLKVRNGMPEAELVRRAREVGVNIAGLSAYFLSPADEIPEATLVVGYSGFPSEDVETAISLLETAWQTEIMR
jgi:GntR family transcriptional regulator/MocR family aminotransferase